MRIPNVILLLLLLAGLSACTPTPRVETEAAPEPPAQFAAADYQRAARSGALVYRVDPEASLMSVYVHSEGPLAPTLGHSHVVSTRQIHGYLQGRGPGSRADFYIAVEDLVVDDPQLRAEAGFTSDLSEADVEATRRNMLVEVLESERFPYVLLHLDYLPPKGAGEPISGILTLHGESRKIELPATVTQTPDQLRAQGRLRITHTRFGMTPYSAFAGALRVSDSMDMFFDILARRVGAENGGRQ